jgi:hypothetical protein
MSAQERSAYAATTIAINQLESGQEKLIDIRAIAQEFVQKRLSNTKSVEDIRRKALDKLSLKLDDPELKITTTGLLDIIDTLNNSSKEDMNTLMRASGGDASKTPNNGGNYYNIFMPAQTANGNGAFMNSQQFGMIEKLVSAAEIIVEDNKNK